MSLGDRWLTIPSQYMLWGTRIGLQVLAARPSTRTIILSDMQRSGEFPRLAIHDTATLIEVISIDPTRSAIASPTEQWASLRKHC